MTFQIIEPCHGTASFCGPYVLANGIIEEDSYIILLPIKNIVKLS